MATRCACAIAALPGARRFRSVAGAVSDALRRRIDLRDALSHQISQSEEASRAAGISIPRSAPWTESRATALVTFGCAQDRSASALTTAARDCRAAYSVVLLGGAVALIGAASLVSEPAECAEYRAEMRARQQVERSY